MAGALLPARRQRRPHLDRRSRLIPRDQPRATGARFDVIGVVLLFAFLAVLITAIVQVRTAGRGVVLGLAAGAVVLLVALVLSQRRGSARLVAPELLRHRPFQAATLAGFGAGLGIVSVMAFSATFLVRGLGMSTLAAGATTTLWSGVSAIAALALRGYTARITGERQLVLGLLGVSVGAVLMAGVTAQSGLARLMIGTAVAGLATALLNGGLARQAVATVLGDDAAKGTAANNTARYVGAAIGVSAASIIAAGAQISTGWTIVVCASAVLSLLSAVIVARWSRGVPAQ